MNGFNHLGDSLVKTFAWLTVLGVVSFLAAVTFFVLWITK